jgi:hypothetical protein
LEVSGVGCGHLKAILRDYEAYDTPQQLTRWFLTAFFQYMWLEDAERSKEDKKLLYVVLQGDHQEVAVIEVHDFGCPGLAAAVASETEKNEFFVHHQAATEFLRKDLAHFFVKVSS